MARMGINRAEEESRQLREQSFFEQDRCIFLSHSSKDKEAVREIGKYIMKAGIDIYLDENDMDLQTAALNDDHSKVTDCIEKGIRNSTDIFCIVSEETKDSWWVPYEIGYGKRSDISLYTFLLIDVLYIPSYLKICGIIKDRDDLNKVLGKLSQSRLVTEASLYSYKYQQGAGTLMDYATPNHPLSEYVRSFRVD